MTEAKDNKRLMREGALYVYIGDCVTEEYGGVEYVCSKADINAPAQHLTVV